MDMTGLLIYAPSYQQNMKSPTVGSIYAVGQMLAWSRIKNQLLAFSAADIVDSRNLMTTLWYDSYPQYSHMLMVDSDMAFPPQLVREMIDSKHPLVGVVYARRELPLAMVGVLPENGVCEVNGGFVRMKYVGAGVTLISRDVITQIIKKYPELNDTTDMGRLGKLGVTRQLRVFDRMTSTEGQPLSEDYSLCERWRHCGGEVWASMDHEVNHIGDYNYSVRGRDLLLGQQIPAPIAEPAREMVAA